MKNWSLKVKIGAYAALLSVVALGVTALVIMPAVYFRQLAELDVTLSTEADELDRDMRNFRGAPVDPRKPLSVHVIPLALRERYLTIWGPEGQVLYRSPNLAESDLEPRPPGMETVDLLGSQCRLGAFAREPYFIAIGAPLDTLDGFQRDLRRGFLVALPATALVVFGGGLLLGRKAIAPVADLTEAAERISANRPEERLPPPASQDEIARLTEVLNESFDRMQASYDAARQFSADASHQLKTPVSILRIGLSELREREGFSDADRDEVQLLLQQTRRLSALIEDLLLLAQMDAGRLKLEAREFDLAERLASSVDDIETLTMDRGIEVKSELPGALQVHGDGRGVALVLQNLVENAAKYTPDGGKIRVSLVARDGMARVRVGNDGGGVPKEDRERLFERFYRGRSVGENIRGQGLGLNIARELARSQGGELELVASEAGWTEFEFRLPAV